MKTLVTKSFRYASGSIASRVAVSVVARGTDELATIYSFADPNVETDNPTVTSVTGGIAFYAESGQYDLLAMGSRFLIDVSSPDQEAIDAAVSASLNPTYGSMVYEGGNLVSWIQNGIACSATYDANGNVQTLTVGGTTRTFDYDSDGNLIGAI